MNNHYKKIAFRVLGCRLNQSEVNSLKNEFSSQGYEVVDQTQEADITIINSCAVTQQAAAKTRAEVNAANKISPHGKIIMTGCYAQEKKSALLSLDNVHMVIGNLEKTQLLDFVDHFDDWDNQTKVADVNDSQLLQTHDYYTFSQEGIAETDRTRAFVKIQDGCNYFCSYCIIPYLRGRVRSRKKKEVIKEVIALEQSGYKELVLSGINIGTYQDAETDLTELIQKILANTDSVRLRLSSIEPNLITDKLITLMARENRLCNYFHIPLQHGSERILKLMNRKYTRPEFTKVISKIRQSIPRVSIGTDAIVGFPEETKADFQSMYNYIEKMKFSYLHVFRYSKRAGTKASKMKNFVDGKTKKDRSGKLRQLGEKLQETYIKQFDGHELTVLFEQAMEQNLWGGNSDNYIYVKVKSNKNLTNNLKKVKITDCFQSHAEGKLIE